MEYADGGSGILVKRIKPDFKKFGHRYGKIMKQLAASIAQMEQADIATMEKNSEFSFNIEGVTAVVTLADVEIISEDIPGWLVANEGNLTIALDVTITEELRREGLARELVNRIQNIRKSSGLEITDKIAIRLESNPETDDAINDYKAYIATQVLATEIEIGQLEKTERTTIMDFDDFKLKIEIEKRS